MYKYLEETIYGDEFVEKVKNILKNMKTTEIKWGEYSYNLSKKAFIGNYIDIYTPHLCKKLNLNWLITIEREESELGYLKKVGEVKKIGLEKFKKNISRESTIYQDKIELGVDGFISAYYSEKLMWYKKTGAKYIKFDSLTKNYLSNLEEDRYLIPSWSITNINQSLTAWAERLSGRRFEFSYDKYIIPPFYQNLKEIIKNDERYMIDDGVYATSTAFDQISKINQEDLEKIYSSLKSIKNKKRRLE